VQQRLNDQSDEWLKKIPKRDETEPSSRFFSGKSVGLVRRNKPASPAF
jgi:hypothetical protein